MSFPLYYFLFPIALFALVYVIFILMDVYHLISFAEVHFIFLLLQNLKVSNMQYGNIIKQKQYEKIIYLLRRDTVTFVSRIFLLVVLAGVGYGLYFLLKLLFPALFINNISFAILILLGSVYALSIWLFFYTAFVNYFLDIWIVTNDRIIDIRQQGLFARTVAELDLFRVQDVTSECHGLFATIFDFGNVATDINLKAAYNGPLF
ncbi:MAG: hypothetical protein UU69_C0014G0013 [Candidatus Magasanikbacteria bacterium GW2011_GWA2_41_55]|uniref:DUF304 domain-containing protein n=1 Tax=Candidatus Magasanikbacteria bacterium GW2011_GWA2_41_55 TaxID=1619038 RepID=A0A0G0WJL4_9BACT|nr:MAG: hypothetical protein UU69_C0014G0013 [Candidatus Magasanikbacteria bacterium GW2011_GWA2_41_55]